MTAGTSAVVVPLYIGDVGFAAVRFFESPMDGPDLVWSSAADLLAAAGLPKPIKCRYLAAATKMGQTIETPAGPVAIIPHAKAAEMLGVLIDHGRTSYQVRKEYGLEVAEAERVATTRLTPQQQFEYLIAGNQRHQRVVAEVD